MKEITDRKFVTYDIGDVQEGFFFFFLDSMSEPVYKAWLYQKGTDFKKGIMRIKKECDSFEKFVHDVLDAFLIPGAEVLFEGYVHDLYVLADHYSDIDEEC